MAKTYDLKRLFAQPIALQKTSPLFHRWDTYETSEPFRFSPKSLIFRVPFTTIGVVIGWWQDTGWQEEEAVEQALGGSGSIDIYVPEGVDLENENVRRSVRANIARQSAEQGLSLDDEWKIMSMVGVDR